MSEPTCGSRYGSNPDPCHRPADHEGAHSNRWGTAWASERQWMTRATPDHQPDRTSTDDEERTP